MSEIRADEITVRGNATAEELAAVLATLAQRRAPGSNSYERWRRNRLAAVRDARDRVSSRRPWDA